MTAQHPEIRPEQSIELLKQLHILTRDGKLNQDSRRKLKQVYHLYQFIEPLLAEALADAARRSSSSTMARASPTSASSSTTCSSSSTPRPAASTASRRATSWC